MTNDPIRILFVDDSRDALLMSRWLVHKTRLPAAIDTACSAEAAMSMLEASAQGARETGFALVFTDLNMPGMNGCDLITWIRDHSRFGDLPVIALSASSSQADVNAAWEAGADAYVTKYPDTPTLALVLQSARDGRQQVRCLGLGLPPTDPAVFARTEPDAFALRRQSP